MPGAGMIVPDAVSPAKNWTESPRVCTARTSFSAGWLLCPLIAWNG